MKITFRLLGIILIFILLVTGCGGEAGEISHLDKLTVYTSIYPLEDFTRKIGGNHVEVFSVIPPGTEPHDFEISAQTMVKISRADVFVYNGAGLESWAERVVKQLNPDRTLTVEATKGLPLLELGGTHDHEGHETTVHNRHANVDPHVWLDPSLAKLQAERIRDALIKKDPQHRSDYQKNYEQLTQELDKLDQEFKEMVEKAPKKTIVVSHDAFGYLANRYGLKTVPISGLSPSDEPSSQELRKMIQHLKENDIDVILFETLVSGKMAEVVRKELNAEALVLNPLENLTEEEKKQGMDYFSVMRMNKENLAKALGVSS